MSADHSHSRASHSGTSHDHHRHEHQRGHGHGHSYGGHSHAPATFGRAFAIGTSVNLGFVLVEAGYGLATGSMALLADAGHNLSDVLGLGIAWTAAILGRRAPAGRYTYGLRSSSILAALMNAILLLVAVGVIAVEAIDRLFHPAPVPGITMMVVAGIGIAVNLGTALLFAGKDELNMRGAFLHLAADAAISAGVVLAGFVILKTGLDWIDPAISLIIVVVITAGTWGLLRRSLDMSLHAAPPGIEPTEVSTFLAESPGVAALHDLHIWPMSTTETALTVHLVVPGGHPGDAFTSALATRLHDRFGIGHSTIQIETGPCEGCTLHGPTI